MEENYHMKIKILLIGAAALLVLLASAWAADVTGKWVAQVQGRQGTSENTFNFKVEGTTLTGTLATARGEDPITEGKVSGDEISFVVVRKFGENEMKTLWKGKVSGDEIKFTREFQGGMMGGPGGGGPPGGGAGGPGGGAGAGAPGGGPGGGGFGGPPPEIIAKRVK
jgi:hypothetical protein